MNFRRFFGNILKYGILSRTCIVGNMAIAKTYSRKLEFVGSRYIKAFVRSCRSDSMANKKSANKKSLWKAWRLWIRRCITGSNCKLISVIHTCTE